MTSIYRTLFYLALSTAPSTAQTTLNQPKSTTDDARVITTASHIPGLQIAMLHKAPAAHATDYPVLFLHGSSFPSALSFGFRMNGTSWMDHLAENGYDTYALDFLGYGHSDRYPEMTANIADGTPVGRAIDVYQDVDRAIDLIIKRTGKSKVSLIGHSWGGAVAALYAATYPEKIHKIVLFAAITPRQDTSALTQINHVFDTMTPDDRIDGMKSLTPPNEHNQLEQEISDIWPNAWLRSDPLAAKFKSTHVRFPAGPSQDIEDMLHKKTLYNPAAIRMPVLIIRGEWDEYPDHTDATQLFDALPNTTYKKYLILEKGTHVMHLEKTRYRLYDETFQFLKAPY